MTAENILPEERLFNIIKNQRDKPVKKDSFPRKLSTAALSLKQHCQLKSGINFYGVNKIFAFILIILAGILAGSLNKRRDINKIFENISKIKPPVYEMNSIQPFSSLESYQRKADERNIFLPAAKIKKDDVRLAGPSLKELAKDLFLAGIYQGQDLEAIIEDKAAKKTYFLKQGDEIKGIKIKSILNDRVILEYGGEEIELL